MTVKEEIIINALKREKEIAIQREKEVKEELFLYASPIRMMILTALWFKDGMTKTEIHNLIEKAGLKIAYKNTSTNIDQLEQKGLVIYKKGERYNTTVVCNNRNKIFEYQDKLLNQKQTSAKTREKRIKTILQLIEKKKK